MGAIAGAAIGAAAGNPGIGAGVGAGTGLLVVPELVRMSGMEQASRCNSDIILPTSNACTPKETKFQVLSR